LVVIDEFLTVSLYQPNEFISRNELRHFGLGRDKTRHETSFKCLRHETLQDMRQDKTLSIRLRRDEDTLKMSETQILPMYSYQDTL